MDRVPLGMARFYQLPLERDKRSNLFAHHLAPFFNKRPAPKTLRPMMDFQVIKQLNPLSTMKSFGGSACSLCMGGKLRILCRTRNEKVEFVTFCLEIYGAHAPSQAEVPHVSPVHMSPYRQKGYQMRE